MNAPPDGFEFLPGLLPDAIFDGTLSVIDTILHVMHADIVVETGSSLTALVHTLTDVPLFMRGCPKEGCHITFMDVDGLVKLDEAASITKMCKACCCT